MVFRQFVGGLSKGANRGIFPSRPQRLHVQRGVNSFPLSALDGANGYIIKWFEPRLE